jgi:transcriptional regulator
MYTPRFNQVSDRAVLLEAMRSYSFGLLFGAETATHLPLLIKDEGEHGLIECHFARANPHWKALAGHETLVVFPGPHTYVSPSLYVEELSVPTWNYIAIHAYGTLELLEDDAGKQRLVEELVAQHEPAYLDRWHTLPQGYQHTMLAGIMGFRMPITRIEGKFKLSQNRAEPERVNVRDAHAAGSDDQRELARWMDRLLFNAPATPESRTQ